MSMDYVDGFVDGQRHCRLPATAPFLVFADAVGYKTPSYKHPTRTAAEAEAKRLAVLNPGVNYWVLGAVSVTAATKPIAGTRNLV